MAKLLVVDDSPEIVSWLQYELREAGHMVSTATNGEEGLLLMELERPELVLLDIDMPVMNGFQMLKKFRGMKDLHDVHVVMLTGRGREADWVQGYKLGVHDYLTKPLEVDELLEAIERTLASTPEQIQQRCQEELEKSEMLLKLENMFEETSPGLPDTFIEEPVLEEPAAAEETEPEPGPEGKPRRKRRRLFS